MTTRALLRRLWIPTAVCVGAMLSLTKYVNQNASSGVDELRRLLLDQQLLPYPRSTMLHDASRNDPLLSSSLVRESTTGEEKDPFKQLAQRIAQSTTTTAIKNQSTPILLYYNSIQLERERHLYQNQRTSVLITPLLQQAIRNHHTNQLDQLITFSLTYYMTQDPWWGQRAADLFTSDLLTSQHLYNYPHLPAVLDAIELIKPLLSTDTTLALKIRLKTYMERDLSNNSNDIVSDVQHYALALYFQLKQRQTLMKRLLEGRLDAARSTSAWMQHFMAVRMQQNHNVEASYKKLCQACLHQTPHKQTTEWQSVKQLCRRNCPALRRRIGVVREVSSGFLPPYWKLGLPQPVIE
jgi:hypothetical protein